jgi:glycerol-3-phosphate acyltransferase PlsY
VSAKVFKSILLIITAYLLGSISPSYLATRWFKGFDLRRYGSGTVSGSMVWEHVARWAIVPVGLFDIGKAAFPVWSGLQMKLGMPVAVVAGLSAVAGHNWSMYLHCTGGRGLSPMMGIWLVIFPWGFPWMLGFLTAGWVLGDSAPWALASLVTLPFFAFSIGGPAIVKPTTAGFLLLTLMKRLEANGRPLPTSGSKRQRVILYRLLLDRDIRCHADWIKRKPDEVR